MANKDANKSEERLKARFEVFTEKRRRQITSVAGSALIPQEHEMILEDHLHITLLRRNSPLPLFKVQLAMLTDLVTSEQAISQYKKAKTERQGTLDNNLASGSEDEELRWIDREIHFHQAICRAIRDIADGIAWRLFDYDRTTLTIIANRPSSKHINPTGIESELLEFAHVFESKEGIAILNDLTNCLKLADVTIRKDEGTFELVEVKTGHKSSGRITRQKQDLRRTVGLINTGKTDDERMDISQLDVTPQTYLRNIVSVIQEAEKNGAGIQIIGGYLLVECTDFEKASEKEFEKIKLILDRGKERRAKWVRDGDIVIDLLSQDKYMDVKNYAPFSVYPLSERIRVRLMIGSLFLVSYLNVSAVLRYIQERGWKLMKSPEEHADEHRASESVDQMWLATVRKGPLTVAIPFQLFGRIGFEFLKPKSLIDIFEAKLAAGPTDIAMNMCNLSGEPEIWD